MTASAVGLVLASAFLHALWNAAVKREAAPEVAAVGAFIFAALSGALLAPFSSTDPFPTAASWVWAVAAGVFEAGYVTTLARAFARAPLGLTYAIARGGAVLAVWPVSVALLGETITPASAAGAAILCLGLGATGLDDASRRSAAGVLWGVLCAAFIAGYHLSYKLALKAHADPFALFAVSLVVAVPLNLTALGRSGRMRLRDHVRTRLARLVGIGVLCTCSFLLFLNALSIAGAGAVLTLRNTSIVFAIGLAFAIGERPTRQQIIGSILVTLGAIMLGLGP